MRPEEVELLNLLTRAVKGLERIHADLTPLMRELQDQKRTMPIPVGNAGCEKCEGRGIVMVRDENDDWKSKRCNCYKEIRE